MKLISGRAHDLHLRDVVVVAVGRDRRAALRDTTTIRTVGEVRAPLRLTAAPAARRHLVGKLILWLFLQWYFDESSCIYSNKRGRSCTWGKVCNLKAIL